MAPLSAEAQVDTEVAEARYNAVPYISKPYMESHPDRMATIAHLLGHDAPDIHTARVLEIGCGLGGNLVPMAVSLPDASFVGFDIAAVQIDMARELAQVAGASNIRFEVRDILDVPQDYGEFDYILVHGIYSWVPTPVREELMRLVKRHLSPKGVAFVSYNCWPGWGFRRHLRDMMLFAAGGERDPERAVRRARELMALAMKLSKEGSPMRLVLEQHVSMLAGLPDSYVFHDFLADVNQPFWFHEFCDHVHHEGLQYLGEANFPDMVAHDVSDAALEELERLGADLVRKEQYKDYLRNRGFRESLLVHGDASPDRNVTWDRLVPLHVSARVRPVGDEDLTEGVEMEFRSREGRVFGTERALLKAALLEISQVLPNSVPVDELRLRARRRIGGDPSQTRDADRELLCRNLLYLYGRRLAELHLREIDGCAAISDRPRAWTLARHCALMDAQYIPNIRHESVIVSNRYERVLLRLLDGTRDKAELVAGLVDAARTGELLVQDDTGEVVSDAAVIAEAMAIALDDGLVALQRLGLLEG